jgi:hypothetical protein
MAIASTPENFTIIRSDDRLSVLIAWDVVGTDIDGAPITVDGYDIQRSVVNNGLKFANALTVLPVAGATRQYAEIDNLDPDIMYDFKIRALSALYGDSDFSERTTDY